MENDVDDGVECPRREPLGAGDEVSGSIVDQTIERTVAPNLIEHGLDLVGDTQVANDIRRLGSGFPPFGNRSLEDVLSPSANDDLGSELDETRTEAFADPGATARDQDFLSLQDFVRKHPENPPSCNHRRTWSASTCGNR